MDDGQYHRLDDLKPKSVTPFMRGIPIAQESDRDIPIKSVKYGRNYRMNS